MIIDRLNDKDIILASKSPRRKKLLQDLGMIFKTISSGADETHPENVSIENVPEVLSQRKAQVVAKEFPNSLIIAADTVVAFKDSILEKPGNYQMAVEMLQQISGNEHTVISGVTIYYKNKMYGFSEYTQVCFSLLEKIEIEYYVKNQKPFDKAGSYGIQDWIGLFGVRWIKGCYYNVMGLPTSSLIAQLKRIL